MINHPKRRLTRAEFQKALEAGSNAGSASSFDEVISRLGEQNGAAVLPALAAAEITAVLPTSRKESFSQSDAQVAPLVVPEGVLPMACGLKPEEESDKRQQIVKSQLNGKRPNPLSIRVTEAQRELLQTKASQAGTSVGGYILAVLLSSDYTPPHDKDWTRALLDANRELTRQGTNLNQLAYKRNSNLVDEAQTNSILGVMARAYLQSHQAVRAALALGRKAEP